LAGEKILIVDDEPEITELISLYLVKEGFRVVIGADGFKALELTRTEKPDLIILDVLLPGLDGFEVCYELRKETDVPILFLSCKDQEMDKILGLGIGGDDYITKPFSPGELRARVKAQLRRARQSVTQANQGQVLRFPGLEIDFGSYTVSANGAPVNLSSTEFLLLSAMAQNPNQVFSTAQLFNIVWKEKSLGDARTVMVHISNLRRKIESDPASPRYILTVRGIGYKFSYPARTIADTQ